MTSPYKNAWLRNPYANVKLEAARAKAAKARRDWVQNLAIFSGPMAMVLILIAVCAFR